MKILVCLMAVSLGLMVGCKSMKCCQKPPCADKAAAKEMEAAPAAAAADTMKAVESSTIDKIGYDAAGEKLTISFDSGETYNYLKVPEKTYKGLMKAKSKGKYFHKNIKDQFEAEKAQ